MFEEQTPTVRLGDVLRSVLGRNWRSCPGWPPDMFAATAVVLRLTGLYTRIVGLAEASGRALIDTRQWPMQAETLANAWRVNIRRHTFPTARTAPLDLKDWWQILVEAADIRLDAAWAQAAGGHDEVARALLRCTTVADAACHDIGGELPQDSDKFGWISEINLLHSDFQSTCSPNVDPMIVRVLPKQHTPQRGLTLRSLSHHLALVPPSEVKTIWTPPTRLRTGSNRDIFNILLLPWPLEVRASDFRLVEADDKASPSLAPSFRFFRYRRRSTPRAFESYLKSAMAAAKQHTERIDIMVLPELALTPAELRVARAAADREQSWLVGGVSVDTGNDAPGNFAVVDVGWGDRGSIPGKQRKHHRWCLDGSQIRQYGLTATLPASANCWEYTRVGERRLQFWSVASWLTFTVLICEDLARQDPVGEVVRAVGPNLIFALLMDGPQIQQRWGAKYASVLAEDPGSSVLTVTSLGMSALSRPASAGTPDRRRVVALWRDAISGVHEIELGPSEHAGLLNVVCETKQEFTCDGRGDGGNAHYPVLAGFRGLKFPMPGSS